MNKSIPLAIVILCACGCCTPDSADPHQQKPGPGDVIIPSIKEYLDRRPTLLPIDSHEIATLAALYAGSDYVRWYLNIPTYTPEHEVFIEDVSRYIVSLRIRDIQGFGNPDDAFMDLQCATALRALNIDGLPVSGDSLKHLWDLPNLSTLVISNTPIGDKDISNILRIERLRKLIIDGSQLTDEGVRELQQLGPKIEVIITE